MVRDAFSPVVFMTAPGCTGEIYAYAAHCTVMVTIRTDMQKKGHLL